MFIVKAKIYRRIGDNLSDLGLTGNRYGPFIVENDAMQKGKLMALDLLEHKDASYFCKVTTHKAGSKKTIRTSIVSPIV